MEASIKEFQREQGFTSNTTVDEIIKDMESGLSVN